MKAKNDSKKHRKHREEHVSLEAQRGDQEDIKTSPVSTDTQNTELTIYTTYVNKNQLEQFTPMKFRNVDSSDAPGIALKVFSFVIGIVGGAHPLNPLFRQVSGPDGKLLSMAISSLKELANRGKVYLPKDKFPHIDPMYVTASVADWIKLGEDQLIDPIDNPYYKNGFTRTPTLKDNWSLVYIISLCSPEEFEEKGLDNGYMTLTRNDAVQLCKLIAEGKFLPPDEYENLKDQENDIEVSDKQSAESILLEVPDPDPENELAAEQDPHPRIFKFDGSLNEETSEKTIEDISLASDEKESKNEELDSQEVVSPVDHNLGSGARFFQNEKQTKPIDIPLLDKQKLT